MLITQQFASVSPSSSHFFFALPWYLLWSAVETLLQHLEHHLPLLLSAVCPQGYFSHIFSSSSPSALQCFAFSKTYLSWGATLSSVGLSSALWWAGWSRLELAVSGTEQPHLFSQRPPCSSHCQYLDNCTQYSMLYYRKCN